jgi:hypothetical protein
LVVCREKRPPLALPNSIDPEKGTVRGMSIKYGSIVGSTDQWNRVLKYMLVDLKILLHWVTKDQGIVDAGSNTVPPQMTAVATAGSMGGGGANLADSTIVHQSSGRAGAHRMAQSMMQT